ncbi:hypothetical protein FRB98_007437, partial [Tulasnella sp. 332]
LSAKIEEYISPALAYACLYWTDHLSEARTDSKESLEVDSLVEHFVEQKILYWIEVLSLLGKTKEAVILLRSADTWVTARASLVTLDPSLSVLLRDARRFLLEFMEPISTSSLHIYSSALAFSPSSTELVASYGHMLEAGPKPLRGRSVKWSNTLWVGSKHSNAVTCLEWSPSGKILASGSHDATVRLWDKETGTVVGGGPLGGHTCGVLCLAWSPGGKVLASGSANTNLRLWEADTGATFGIPLVGHADKNDVADGGPLEGHTSHVSCIAWSPKEDVLASGSWDNTVRLWDVGTATTISRQLIGHTSHVECLAWSSNGNILASGSKDTIVLLWNVESGAPLTLKGHAKTVTCLAWSPLETILASGSYDHTLQMWDPETATAVGEPSIGHTEAISCVAWSPSETILASGSRDHTIRLWEAETGTTIGGLLNGHTSDVRCLVWSPDGKTLASGSTDATLRVWDVEVGVAAGEPLIEAHGNKISCVAWSPNAKVLVSGSWDSSLHLWDAATGASIGGRLEGHTACILCVAWSPNSSILASRSIDETARIWDVGTSVGTGVETGAAMGRPLRGYTRVSPVSPGRPTGRSLHLILGTKLLFFGPSTPWKLLAGLLKISSHVLPGQQMETISSPKTTASHWLWMSQQAPTFPSLVLNRD